MECSSVVKLEEIFHCIDGLICHIVYSSISSRLTYLFASIQDPAAIKKGITTISRFNQ